MNTADSTSAMAISAVPTSSMVERAASMGASPSASLRSTFSTTTMASSTTMPTASTRPNSVSMLMEKPKPCITAKVPISDTGMATRGMTAARHACRNTRMTTTTSATASRMVRYSSLIETSMNSVGL